MCGIAGKIDLEQPVDEALLVRMCEAVAHRGPDSRGIHIRGGVGLGIQRLAVIDLNTGDQPIYNEDGSIAVVLNGEIYNYVELRKELRSRGHRLSTHGDTETIVHLYEEMGERCVERLRGMFAFALWDARNGRLLLARDRLGKKPLFFRETPTALWFASEPRAILQDPAISPEPDPAALDSCLRFGYVPDQASAFRDLRKLPPAHVLLWSGGRSQTHRYWQLDYGAHAAVSPAEAEEVVRDSLLEATRIRMRSDVPLGAFLSGGLDSSAVVAAMVRESSSQVKTFSIGFDVPGYDETQHARRVAAHLGTDHHEFRVHPDMIEILPRLVWHYGEPFADSSALPSFLLAQLTREHVTVALNGDGGDEGFAGYTRYQAQRYSDRLAMLPLSLRKMIADGAVRIGRGPGSRTTRSRIVRGLSTLGLEPWQRYDGWMTTFPRAELNALYTPEYAAELPAGLPADDLIRRPWLGSSADNHVEVMLDVDVQSYLPGDLLVKMDIATMAHSLEVRSPFLDHVLMERVARLPAAFKLKVGTTKALLKNAMRPWLPSEVIDRPKMGFGVPLADWFRGALADLPSEVLLDETATARGIFRPEGVRELILAHQSGAADNASRLWTLLTLELWLRTYVDQPAPRPVAGIGAI